MREKMPDRFADLFIYLFIYLSIYLCLLALLFMFISHWHCGIFSGLKSPANTFLGGEGIFYRRSLNLILTLAPV